MLWVTFGWEFESIFLGCEDLSPSISEQILVSLKLLLFFLQALRSGYKPALEALLLDGIFRHGKFFVAEPHLILGGRHVIIVLRLSICCSLGRAGFSILLL